MSNFDQTAEIFQFFGDSSLGQDAHVPVTAAPSGSMVRWITQDYAYGRAEGDLIGRVTELTKQHPSVPRHPINGEEYLSPTEIGKVRDDIV